MVFGHFLGFPARLRFRNGVAIYGAPRLHADGLAPAAHGEGLAHVGEPRVGRVEQGLEEGALGEGVVELGGDGHVPARWRC